MVHKWVITLLMVLCCEWTQQGDRAQWGESYDKGATSASSVLNTTRPDRPQWEEVGMKDLLVSNIAQTTYGHSRVQTSQYKEFYGQCPTDKENWENLISHAETIEKESRQVWHYIYFLYSLRL